MAWCKECWSSTSNHRAGCPNAPDPPVVLDCVWCGAGIREGEDFYEFRGDCYHTECFNENAVEIIIREELGLVLKTAERG